MQSLVAISVFVFEVSKDEWGRASPYGRRSRQADGLQLLAHVTGPKLNPYGITDPEFILFSNNNAQAACRYIRVCKLSYLTRCVLCLLRLLLCVCSTSRFFFAKYM